MFDNLKYLYILQLYSADQQRVDLVLLDLEGMLGKTLSVGAQQERYLIHCDGIFLNLFILYIWLYVRWEELQRQGPDIVELNRHLNNPGDNQQHPHPIVHIDEDLIQLSPPSTSGHVNRQQFLNSVTTQNTPVAGQSSSNSRKILTAVRRVSIFACSYICFYIS